MGQTREQRLLDRTPASHATLQTASRSALFVTLYRPEAITFEHSISMSFAGPTHGSIYSGDQRFLSRSLVGRKPNERRSRSGIQLGSIVVREAIYCSG